MRINKYIASSGLCSRRKAEEYIEKGQVTINGITATLSSTVEDNDSVYGCGVVEDALQKSVCAR